MQTAELFEAANLPWCWYSGTEMTRYEDVKKHIENWRWTLVSNEHIIPVSWGIADRLHAKGGYRNLVQCAAIFNGMMGNYAVVIKYEFRKRLHDYYAGHRTFHARDYPKALAIRNAIFAEYGVKPNDFPKHGIWWANMTHEMNGVYIAEQRFILKNFGFDIAEAG